MPAGDMDMEYSIGTTNRFGLACNDMNDDPLELIQAALDKPAKKEKEPKGKGKKEAKSGKGAKEKSAKTEAAPVNNVPESKKTEGSDRARGRGRGRGRGSGGRGRGRGGGGFSSSDSPREESVSGFGDGGSSQSTGGSKGACRKCHEEGHFARECPNVESAPRSNACHKCGEEGHFARECPKSGPPGGGACHKCNEVGHFARECPQNNQPLAGFGDSSGGGFSAPSSGGFGSEVSGAPSSGFGAPSGGFGASSGGFGGDEESEKRGGRAGYRGRGRGGRGRGRGREFDRRSGSDKSSSVKASEKRDGAGSYNWGTPQDELEASEEQGGFGTPKETQDYSGETAEVQEDNDSGEENKENAGAQEITYEEWKKQQEVRSKPQHNIRQANEGEKLKGVKQLKKPTEEENEADGSLFFPKKYYEERLKTSGRVKEHMNLEFQFASGDNRHLDNGRRGGRSGRGRGGRGGRKDNESGFGNSNKQIQLEDTEEFPSLV